VANGGTCVATQAGGPGTPVSISLTGVDFSLNHFPRYYSGTTYPYVSPVNLFDSTNRFFVVSKVIYFWAPLSSVPLGTTTAYNSYSGLVTQSVTGQTNQEPTLVNNRAVFYLMKNYSAQYGKYTMSGNTTLTASDERFDTSQNPTAPGQYTRWYISFTNNGTFPLSNVKICDLFDNTRQSFTPFQEFWGTGKPYPLTDLLASNGRLSSSGVKWDYYGSTVINTSDMLVELGVGGINGVGQSWGTYDNDKYPQHIINSVNFRYAPTPYTSVSSSALGNQANSSCADNQSTNGVWFSSIADLENAGYTQADVTKIRFTLLKDLPVGDGFGISIMSKIEPTYKYSSTDYYNISPYPQTQNYNAGDTTVGSFVPNVAYLVSPH
jgi:uncharacterized repeat protein (TIGR01451 family)